MRRIFPILFLVVILLVKNSTVTVANGSPGGGGSSGRSGSKLTGNMCQGLTGIEYTECKACIDRGDAYTAFGCLNTKPGPIISTILKWVIGIAGGLAFLLILYGGFQVLTSSGEPEKLNTGKEIIFSAIAGLLMIVFSLIILRIIGYDILQIPQFIEK
jgi:hypothetical protein